MQSLAILGASRGLGRSLAQIAKTESKDLGLFLFSRKISELSADPILEGAELFPSDFTKLQDQKSILAALHEIQPTAIVYTAGGGPYGDFQSKDFKDHKWALELNLLFPMELAHFVLQQMPATESLFLVGSQVAEAKPDPKAASYAAAKHGLKGFCDTLKAENPNGPVHLFSPPYMDTDMLPANAWPRQQGLAVPVEKVAKQLWQDLQNSVG